MSARKCTARLGTTCENTLRPDKSRFWECSEYILYAGLFAAASGQEFFAWRGGVGTSITELNKDLGRVHRSDRKNKEGCSSAADTGGLGVDSCRLVGCLRQWPASRRPLWRSLARPRRRSDHGSGRAGRAECGHTQEPVQHHHRLCRLRGRSALRRTSLCGARVLQGGRRFHSGLREVQRGEPQGR